MMQSLAEIRREILSSLSRKDQQVIAQELARESFQVPPSLKVSCPFGGCTGSCRSPSKRDAADCKAWVCGSNFSHNDRLGCCVAYRRLHYGLREGQRAGRRGRQ
ncbi:MAG: hypothetical protein NWF00_05000 [Candidatus Bathyarchaeota archaeon]|nr:hypothetical protein [Candidatus Bathyarchaeota archaeon]